MALRPGAANAPGRIVVSSSSDELQLPSDVISASSDAVISALSDADHDLENLEPKAKESATDPKRKCYPRRSRPPAKQRGSKRVYQPRDWRI